MYICCLQEVRYKNSGTTSFGNNDEKYKLSYCGNEDGTAGVGILIKRCLAERVLEVVRADGRIIKIKVLLGKTIYHVYSVYAPQSGRTSVKVAGFFYEIGRKRSDIIHTMLRGEGCAFIEKRCKGCH